MSVERRNRVVKQALELRPMLVGYAYGLLRQHARAEDAVHEAYLVVMDKCEQFKEGTSCRTKSTMMTLPLLAGKGTPEGGF